MTRAMFIAIVLFLTACAGDVLPAGAEGVTSWQRDFGLEVIGTLTTEEQATLRSLLLAVPRGLYQSLKEIHIDGAGGLDQQAMNQINCYSGSALYEVCAHELGHHVDVSSPAHRHEWAAALIAEAGRESHHYLRSTISDGYFVDNPQEFMASMVGAWLIDSQPMWAQALDAYQTGNVHPLNQAILLTAIFGVKPTSGTNPQASVLAYRGTLIELWLVTPWRCDGPVRIAGEGFSVGVTLDAACRVTAVGEREGI